MRFSAFLLLAPILLASPARAQSSADERLTVSGSVRARYEILDGQARAGFGESDDLFSLRTLVFVEYDPGPLRIGAELQDSRVYGPDSGSALSANDVNALEPIQAYVAADIAAPFGKGSKLTLQAGRFTLNLGSRRLVAADDYRNSTNGYTGVRADVTLDDDWQATGIYVLPQQRLPEDIADLRANRVELDREGFDLQLWGGLVSRTDTVFGATAELGFFRLTERDTPRRATRDRKLSSISARIIRAPAAGRWDFEAEGIYQSGRIRSGLGATVPELDVSASFVHADIGYSFPGGLNERLSIEYDRSSGDDAGDRFGRFDTLFGMRRADLAPAGIYAQIGRANISTPGVRLEISPTKRLDAFAVYRVLWLAQATDSFSTTGVRDVSGRSGSFAGHQIEGRMRWWLVPDQVRAEANVALLTKGRFLREAPMGQMVVMSRTSPPRLLSSSNFRRLPLTVVSGPKPPGSFGLTHAKADARPARPAWQRSFEDEIRTKYARSPDEIATIPYARAGNDCERGELEARERARPNPEWKSLVDRRSRQANSWPAKAWGAPLSSPAEGPSSVTIKRPDGFRQPLGCRSNYAFYLGEPHLER